MTANEVAMRSLLERHRESISQTIDTFDRVIFKGHLNGFFPSGAFARYLWQRNVLLKDAGRFFEGETRRIRDHIASVAAAGRPVEYLAGASNHRSGASKEARARRTDAAETKRRTHQISRLIAKLRGHGLITKVKNSRLYRLTARGIKAMWPALRFRRIDFPAAFLASQDTHAA